MTARDNPRWLAAQAEYSEEDHGLTPEAAYVRRIRAAAAMYEIELSSSPA